MVMTSGFRRCTASMAASPSWAVPITWMSGSALRICCRKSRATGESSTIRTVVMYSSMAWPVDSDQSLHHLYEVTLVKAAFHQIGIGSDLDAALSVFARFKRRDQHHGQIGELLVAANLRREGETVHPWHVDVGDHDIDGA